MKLFPLQRVGSVDDEEPECRVVHKDADSAVSSFCINSVSKKSCVTYKQELVSSGTCMCKVGLSGVCWASLHTIYHVITKLSY